MFCCVQAIDNRPPPDLLVADLVASINKMDLNLSVPLDLLRRMRKARARIPLRAHRSLQPALCD